jgi:hypothetical protein
MKSPHAAAVGASIRRALGIGFLLLAAFGFGVGACGVSDTGQPAPDCPMTDACVRCHNPAQCFGDTCGCLCASSSDCSVDAALSVCVDGRCRPAFENGAACQDGDQCFSRICLFGTCHEHFQLPGEMCSRDSDCGTSACRDGKCLCFAGTVGAHAPDGKELQCTSPNLGCCSKAEIDVVYGNDDGSLYTSWYCCPTTRMRCDEVFACDPGQECRADPCCVSAGETCFEDDDCCSGSCQGGACG